MDSRRNFLGKVATGLAGTLAAVPAQVLGANERIRVGIHRRRRSRHGSAQPDPSLPEHRNGRLLRRLHQAAGARQRLGSRRAATYLDYRRLLEDPSIDAVVIATPPAPARRAFLRTRSTPASTCIRKRPWRSRSITPSRCARRIRRTRSKHTVQIGHQACSFGHMSDVQQFLARPGPHGEDHRDRHADAPQHAARQAAVVAAGADDSGS